MSILHYDKHLNLSLEDGLVLKETNLLFLNVLVLVNLSLQV